MDEQQHNGFFGWIDTHPTVALAFAVFLAIAVGAFALRKGTTAPTTNTSATTAGDLSGLQTDANGNPVVYRDIGDTFYNSSIIEGSYNTSALPGNSDHATAFVRSRFNSTTTQSYDTAHPEGIPVRSTPGGNGAVVGSLAYGSQVNVSGSSVVGPSNFVGTSIGGLGSTSWLPLASGGYVSAYDLTGYLS